MWFISNLKTLIYGKSFPSTEGSFYPLTNTSYNVGELTRSDYIRLYISWQYVAVSTIANAVADINHSLTTKKGSEKEINHQHQQLLTYELLQTVVSSLQLTWSAYLLKQRIGKTIDSLQYMRTDCVQLEENEDGSIKGYRYNSKNKNFLFPAEDVIDISLYSPLKTFPHTVKWVSPMQAVAIQAEMDTTANRWNWNIFKNWWSVADILSTTQVMSDEAKERVSNKRKSKFQWVNNAHRIAVLDNGLQYQKVAINQKELDFVESRRFTRDEILAIFKVPKAIIWVTDDVNRATAQVAENTFYKVCISPLARLLEDAFNRHLFTGIWYFEFVNVVPSDNEQMLLDFNSWALTLNEYRKQRWYAPLKDWDNLKTGMVAESVDKEDDKESKMISNIIAKNIKGTPEYKKAREEIGQKKREAKIKRTDVYEAQYIKEVNNIFEDQKKEYTQAVLSKKQIKSNSIASLTKRVVSLTPLYKDLMQSEGNEALAFLWINTMFRAWSDNINKWIRDNIRLVAKEVDNVTKDAMFSIIEQGNTDWIGAEAIARNIDQKFEEFTRTRSRTIARTEITRASNEAEIEAYKQSGVVQKKEWYTALDERTCPECASLHGKVISLWDNFINKWDTYRGIVYDYSNVTWAPLHVNCRCTLLPVIE